jgi:hypothetical protein
MRVGKLFFLLSFILGLISPASGISLTITPENPVTGDEIILRGTASPDEVLPLSISFEKSVCVSDGKYDYL